MRRYLPIAATVVTFGGLGTALLLTSHAATPTASLEAENGAVSSAASNVADATASGGRAVKFGSGSGGGTRTVNCTPAVSATLTNDVSHLCGFPDATNTGVPAGTTLRTVPGQVTSGTGWHWDSRGWVEIDGSGAVFSGFSVPAGGIDVTASNVTISNCQITETGDGWAVGLRSTANVTISHNTISSPSQSGTNRLANGIRDIFGDSDGVQIIGNNIFHANSGINHFDQGGLIKDNYIHDMGFLSGDHVNGIQLGSGAGPLMTIQHNTIFNQIDQTDAVMLATDDGPETNRVVDNNLLAGGGYCVYGAGGPQDVPTNIKFTNNHFARLFFPNCGSFGATAYVSTDASKGNYFTGNIWDDTGSPVSG